MRTINRVAVLGAGTMGARIAAHFANAGVPALLLDLPSPDAPDRSAIARRGLDAALKGKPASLFHPQAVSLMECGNFADDLPRLRECDWILEAVVENLEVKRDLWRRVDSCRREDAILSTNTSGIPLCSMAADFPDPFQKQFLGTHFFNPPRYLHLLELIPGPSTDPALLDFAASFADRRLGKGVVRCKDTPNFIANRIGAFLGGTVLKTMVEDGYTVDEIEALTGRLIGFPKSATFRLFDIVGLDVWAFVGRNLYDAVPHDPWRERFLPPAFLQQMLERKWLGEKSGQGFFKRVGRDREIHSIDWHTLEYAPRGKARFESAEMARNIDDLGQRLKMLVAARDRAGAFLWKVLSDLFVYSAAMVPEISDRIVEIDRAMRWGYGHQLGPFELWDAIGFAETSRRIAAENRALPANVEAALTAGAASLYAHEGAATLYFDFGLRGYQTLEARPGIIHLADLRRGGAVVRSNAGASLIDLGDGVLCVEFHSKANTIGDDAMNMLHAGIEETARNFEAMIVANEGERFSAGANLAMVLLAAQEGEWDELDLACRRFQQMNMALKYAPKPVVAAPFGQALGGGCELSLHARRMQASAELYMGLVEVGVGIIPAGGGCKEMLARHRDVRRVFETIGYAKVSTSAENARELGLMTRADGVSMNPERLIADAKGLALSLVPGYAPGTPRHDIHVGGESAWALMKLAVWTARQGNFITDYDVVIGEKLALVLSGGRLSGEQTVSEQYLLDLEREAFLSLCGDVRTQQRMAHILETGKPLRN
jgi:3-hydroxyacyl-CoA dehydrogenase